MKCPACKLENPSTALLCDRGYRFGSSATASASDPSTISYLRSIDGSLRTIKAIMVVWAVLSLFGVLASMAKH